MNLRDMAALFPDDPFPDIKTVLADFASEHGWGTVTFKNGDNHIYLNGERRGTFVGTEGTRQYLSSNSSVFPIFGNKITVVAKLARCSNKEAYKLLCEKYHVDKTQAERYLKTAPAWDGAFITWEELSHRALRRNEEMSQQKVCTLGIPELDKEFGGIFPGDLVVIGAATGIGKSEFLLNLGAVNAEQGKRVVYYQLEMEEEDPVDRRVMARMNREMFQCGLPFINPVDFRTNSLPPEMQKLKREAYEAESQAMKNMTVYVGEPLNFQRFLESLEAIREKGVDLIILDHLHYFSMDAGETMTESLGEIMRSIRSLTKRSRIPVVFVSHIRKLAQFGAEPTMDDLFASSSIEKESTMGLLLHRQEKRTKVIIGKSRHFGKQNYHVYVRFDPDTRAYHVDKSPVLSQSLPSLP